MKKIIRNCIEVSGIADEISLNLYLYKFLNIRNLLTIPKEDTGIKAIIRVSIEMNKISTKVTNSVEKVSLEGIALTGKRVLISGQLLQTVEYLPESGNEVVHIGFYRVPFNTFLILPENFSKDKQIKVQGYLDDVFIEITNSHNIVEHFNVLLNVEN